MSRALVLGGGGPVGIAWEAGLITGLAERGIRLSEADAVFGTSAGSVVGAQLSQGRDVTDAVNQLSQALERQPAAGEAAAGMEALMTALASGVAANSSPDEIRRALGRFALDAPTMSEDDFLDVFSDLVSGSWPAGYACTAIDAETGEFVVWTADSNVDLRSAVASSCAVPGVYPPVTINGRRYMDGGMRTALNADVAAGFDTAVVVSVTALALPEGMSDPLLDLLVEQTAAELDAVRASGTALAVVEPGAELLDISGWGFHLMDATRAPDAFAAGVRQAADEEQRVKEVWSA
ncbi:MAG: patatin-like phospholipase family protein [Acidimicrobiales bacterium]